MLANSCGPNVHVDTELYHGQAVRWMEEYSAVKGLGNIFRRSAYNSSFLCLQALFSFKFVFGQSIRNEWFLLITYVWYCVEYFENMGQETVFCVGFIETDYFINVCSYRFFYIGKYRFICNGVGSIYFCKMAFLHGG